MAYLVDISPEAQLDTQEAYDWMEPLNINDDKITVWRLTLHHDAPNDALQWAKKTGRLAIGFGAIGDIKAQGYNFVQYITDAIKTNYPNRDNAPGSGDSLHNFCYRMRPGDLVILRSNSKNHLVMEVAGDYEYKSTPEEPPIGDYQHQRKATSLPISPDELWRSVGGIGRNNPYPPLVECVKPIDMETKARLILAYSNSKVHDVTLMSETYVSTDEVNSSAVYPEGAVRQVTVNAYERNPQARRQCIALYGLRCCVCSFDFGTSYGEAGFGYIHVHHLRPLSEISTQYEVNPVTDLRPVCANCHAVIHRRTPPYSIEEVKAMLKT